VPTGAWVSNRHSSCGIPQHVNQGSVPNLSRPELDRAPA
jgi:hypothetical protein